MVILIIFFCFFILVDIFSSIGVPEGVIYIFIMLILILLSFISNEKKSEIKQESEKEGIVGEYTRKDMTIIFIANKDGVIIEGKFGLEILIGMVSFEKYNNYNGLYIDDAIKIVKEEIGNGYLKSVEECTLKALENLKNNLLNFQLDNEDEN